MLEAIANYFLKRLAKMFSACYMGFRKEKPMNDSTTVNVRDLTDTELLQMLTVRSCAERVGLTTQAVYVWARNNAIPMRHRMAIAGLAAERGLQVNRLEFITRNRGTDG